MELMENNDHLKYLKAQQRVKNIKNFYYLVLGYLIITCIILYKNWDGNTFQVKRPESIWMVFLWGIFLLGYGIYLFHPYFKKWEEKKINELMNKNNNL